MSNKYYEKGQYTLNVLSFFITQKWNYLIDFPVLLWYNETEQYNLNKGEPLWLIHTLNIMTIL